jgi:hypothetical protein
MCHEVGNTPGPKKKVRPTEEQIRGAKYLRNVMELLTPLRSHQDCHNRKLHYDEFVAYLLLYFFTPLLDSMRGLQQASNFKILKRKLGLPRFSLGSFSEASRVFDPELLVPIIGELVGQLDDDLGPEQFADLDRVPTAVDGSLLDALPSMVWALWRDDEHRAAKMHLQFDLLKAAPVQATLTDGNRYEPEVLTEQLQAGRLYVVDRGYCDYDLLRAILDAESSFVLRLRSNAVYDVIEERAISAEAEALGIERDVIVHLGSQPCSQVRDQRLRIVRIHVPEQPDLPGQRKRNRVDAKTKAYRTTSTAHTLLLVTDLLDVDVTLVALLYRYRWQIELFFRWFKKILEADRLLCESQNGMTIVTYCALIASLLVTLWTGRKPTKRTYEMLCFYWAGWVDEDELTVHLEALKPADA